MVELKILPQWLDKKSSLYQAHQSYFFFFVAIANYLLTLLDLRSHDRENYDSTVASN